MCNELIIIKIYMQQEEETARRGGKKRREREGGGDVSGSGSGSEDDDEEKERMMMKQQYEQQLQSLRNQLRLCRMDRRTVIENNLAHQREVDQLRSLLNAVVNDDNNNQIQSTRRQQRIAYLEDIIRSGPEHLQMIDERSARLTIMLQELQHQHHQSLL